MYIIWPTCYVRERCVKCTSSDLLAMFVNRCVKCTSSDLLAMIVNRCVKCKSSDLLAMFVIGALSVHHLTYLLCW